MACRVEKEKLDSFNLPFYAPSVDEVRDVIRQSQAFDLIHIHLFESYWDPHDDIEVAVDLIHVQLFESNWDPHDDIEDDGDLVLNGVRSGVSVTKSIKAVIGPLIAHHFGEHVLDDLLELYAKNVVVHLQKVKTKYPVNVVSLKAITRAPKNQQASDKYYSGFTHGHHFM